MRRPLIISAALAVLGAVPLVVVLVVLSGERTRALDVYVLYLGALALLALARATAASGERSSSLTLAPSPEPAPTTRLPELARIEREVALATGTEFDQQLRLKPLLRDIATHRLWTRRGIDLEESPERARVVLGAEVWELVKPEPPDPSRRYWSALDLAGLRGIVDSIEEA